MKAAPPEPVLGTRRSNAAHRNAALLALAALILTWASAALAGPFIWDEDGDRIDDRIETVNVLGFQFSFEANDSLLRQRIDVERVVGNLVYSVYVIYDHPPGDTDITALQAVGMPVRYRYEGLPALRSIATFPQIETAKALPGVERVEAVPLIYPEVRDGAAAMGVRDASQRAFPTWEGTGGADGAGVVIAFLDTGINDAPDGVYPGHESLAGRFLGGATFVDPDSALDTPRDGSVNPVDRGGALTASHATHVASIALGSGGASGYAIGIAPSARFVDVKVLDDLGRGTGVAEALDWCIHNRTRNWGGPAGYEGIDVINLSLSSLDRTDGNDLASRLADRAAELGIVVVASVGNDGTASHVPSPAGGDRVLAVGALDDQRTALVTDDGPAAFSNSGPRASDGDGDSFDEQKPDLLAPGVSILAANGDMLSDGQQYQRLSGTSMAAAFVSGAVACVRSAYPGLSVAQIAELLRATASRQLASVPSGQSGSDPRWYSSIGFGAIDLYAARLEAEQPGRSQIARLELSSGANSIGAVLRTQRELGAAHFVFERAPDQGGTPGSFAPYDSVGATGDPSLADAANRTAYARTWGVPAAELGAAFWYRVSYSEGGTRYDSPARLFVSPTGPSAATLEVTIVHNAYDHDVVGEVLAGSMAQNLLPGGSGTFSAPTFPLPGSGSAVASEWVTGESTTGNVSWTFRIEVPSGAADASLPPTEEHPWVLRAEEGGYLNRSGRITAYRLIWHSQSGDQVFEGGPVPRQTVEGQTAVLAIPQSALGVDPVADSRGVAFGPNPVRAGNDVTCTAPGALRDHLRIFDVAGREVARVPWQNNGESSRARWVARDAGGRALQGGVYFARLGGRGVRVVVLGP